MAVTLPNLFKFDYEKTIRFLAQQQTSILLPFVTQQPTSGVGTRFDRLAPTTLTVVTDRIPSTASTLIDSVFDGRWLYTTRYAVSEYIDTYDKIKAMTDPSSMMSMNKRFAFERQRDKTILDAAIASVATGVTGTGSPAVIPAGQIVAVDYVPTGSPVSSNLTVEKIIKAGEIFNTNQVPMGDPRVLVIFPKQLSSLMLDSRFTSRDFVNNNGRSILEEGMPIPFYGFNIVVANPDLSTYDSGTDVRTCLAWTRSGMIYGSSEELNINVGLDQTRLFTPLTSMEFIVGAMRHDEQKVVEILCDESP